MSKIFPNDTQWAIAGKTTIGALEQLARALPRELQGEGSKVVAGKDGFAALLVFGDLPSESLAKQLLTTVTPVYLLDFDDDAPVTLKFERKTGRIAETRIDKHPADLLEEQDIVAPGCAFTPTPVKDVALVEDVSISQARRAIAARFDAEFAAVFEAQLREHPRGVLMLNGPVGAVIAEKVGRRGYSLYHNPEDGWFSCVVHEPGKERSAFSPGEPDANAIPLDNILGETTLEGILRVLEIPGELIGLSVGQHPAGFLEEHGIMAPGYVLSPTPVREAGIIEGVSVGDAKRALPLDADDVLLRDHPRGVITDNAIIGGMVADELGKRAYLIFYNPEDGHFLCMVQEADHSVSSYSPQKPSPNCPTLDNVLGETTSEGILRVLEIPGEMLGL